VDEYVHFLIDFEGEITGNAIASFLGPRHNCVEVYGMEGYMRTFDFNRKNGTQTIEQDIHGNDIIETKEIKNEDFYTKEIDAFSEAILNESDIPVHGSEGLINQRIIDRVNQEGI